MAGQSVDTKHVARGFRAPGDRRRRRRIRFGASVSTSWSGASATAPGVSPCAAASQILGPRPRADPALQDERAPMGGEPVHHGEAEPGALAHGLRRVERLGGARERPCVHARSFVRHDEAYVIAPGRAPPRRPADSSPRVRPHLLGARRDRDAPALGHGVGWALTTRLRIASSSWFGVDAHRRERRGKRPSRASRAARSSAAAAPSCPRRARRARRPAASGPGAVRRRARRWVSAAPRSQAVTALRTRRWPRSSASGIRLRKED